jgi:peptidylprolyl isomerase domain and WD repeat-containing protein 1
LEGEAIFLNALPDAQMYEKSYMHRDIVTHVAVSKSTDFIITGSIDGHVKFWKKMLTTIEFVKHFQAHLGSINTFEISSDDRKLMTASKDKMIKFFDIQSFDMSNMLSITFTPSCACWLVKNRVAIADADSSFIYVYSSDSDSGVLIEINFHSLPVR